MAREVEWARMTAPDLRAIAERGNALAILPVGSLEQHGPHLPVITDTASAVAAAVRGARLVSEDVPLAVLPGLWLGMSEHHLPFGGTITLDYAAYHGVLRSIVRSLKAIGFTRLLIVNGHGGNVDPLAVAVRELAVEFDMPIVATTPWFLAQEETSALFESDDGPKHACEGEASVMLAIAGDIVKTDKFKDAEALQAGQNEAPHGASRFYSFSERAPKTGTWGFPSKGTAEKGEKFLALHAREVANLITSDILWTRPDPVWCAGRGLQTTGGRAE